MSFRCGGSDGLASALSKSSAVKYFVSQLPDGSIGKNSMQSMLCCNIMIMWSLRQWFNFCTCKVPAWVVSAYYTC